LYHPTAIEEVSIQEKSHKLPEVLQEEDFKLVSEDLLLKAAKSTQPPKSLQPDLDESGVNSVEPLTNVSRVFYNRVPKCGSRTILRDLEVLTDKHNINNFHSEIYNTKQLTPDGEVSPFFACWSQF
jgi:hypothetical protein